MNLSENVHPATPIRRQASTVPRVGELVQVRSRRWLVDEVIDQRAPVLPRCDCSSASRDYSSCRAGNGSQRCFEDSRKFQNEVSEKLAEQVFHALYELFRGFQAAHDASGRDAPRPACSRTPTKSTARCLPSSAARLPPLRGGARNVPDDEAFVRYYSLAGLFNRLRDDAALYPDTMDQRYGAWAQLLVLFRMVHDGADSGAMRLPTPRRLFDPDRYTFLEGRPGGARQVDERIEPPLVPDGTIFRALEQLLVLDGERLSYRALDVEQIGSVYETIRSPVRSP